MNEFFIFIGAMITVNAIGWIPVFIMSAIEQSDAEEACLNWHIIMTMVIAVLFSLLVIDPSLFNLMWIN